MKSPKLLLPLILLLTAQFTFAQEIKTINREGFTLNYPATWAIDLEDEDYDPDRLFSFDAPDGESMIMFMLFDEGIDEDTMMKYQVEAFSEMIDDVEIKNFDTWGNYKGTGKILSGKLMGLFEGSVRVFVRNEENRTMLVVEQYFTKNYDKLKKDFLTFSSSMRLK
jgi:hypothetical protein